FWLKEFHPGWRFRDVDGKKMKSLIQMLQESMAKTKPEYNDDDIVDLFRLFCQKMPEFYRTKKLSILESNYDSIVEEIKSKKNYGNTSRINKAQQSKSFIDQLYSQTNRDS